MAEQMVRERDAAVIELNDAIRQVERYLNSHNPSIRILKQKIDKIDNKMEDLKLCHYEYSRKAKKALDDPEVTVENIEESPLGEDEQETSEDKCKLTEEFLQDL